MPKLYKYTNSKNSQKFHIQIIRIDLTESYQNTYTYKLITNYNTISSSFIVLTPKCTNTNKNMTDIIVNRKYHPNNLMITNFEIIAIKIYYKQIHNSKSTFNFN